MAEDMKAKRSDAAFPDEETTPCFADFDPWVGNKLADRYEILRKLAEGSTAVVYAGRHVGLGKNVAIKILNDQFAADPAVTELILREGRLVGKLGHPHIVEALDVGVTPDGAAYIVLEMLHGHSLSDEISIVRRMPIPRAVRIALQISSAMSAAHDARIIHRDLKPENVFLLDKRSPEDSDHVKVLDFGIAKQPDSATSRSTLTAGGAIVGTPAFMAPEQLLTPSLADHRCDIYALGAVLFEMLSGQRMYQGMEIPEVCDRLVREGPPKLSKVAPDLPEEITVIVEMAMEKIPAGRFQTMEEFGAALRGFLVAAPVVAALRSEPRVDAVARKDAASSPPAPIEITAQTRLPRAEPTQQVRKLEIPSPTSATGAHVHALRPARWQFNALLAIALIPTVLLTWTLWRNRQLAAAQPSIAAAPPAPRVPPPVELEIKSPVAGAQATVRGQSFPTPFKARFKPGAEPEMIEVTAPDHQDRRFWVTLDRDMSLGIDLAAANPPPPAPPVAATSEHHHHHHDDKPSPSSSSSVANAKSE